MLGILLDEQECRELDYMLRKEMEEMLLDLNDHRMSTDIKIAIESRYRMVFRMFARLAPPRELSRYARYRNHR